MPAAPEPTWTWAGEAAPDRAGAEKLLATLAPADRQALLLSHGMALPLGDVAWALKLDPSVVAWRLQQLFSAVAGPERAAGVERGVAALLHERLAAEPATSAPIADPLARLAARHEGAAGRAGRAGGLGIGSLLLIVAAAAGFLIYGVIRDVNPLWRGRELVRQADYEAARQSFYELGSLPEARTWVAFCWLAEGEYERALEVLREEEVAQYLPNAFRPKKGALEPVGADPESAALLPRGLVSLERPTFVFRPVVAGALRLELTASALGSDSPRELRLPVPDMTGRALAVVSYPKDTPKLPTCTVVWSPSGGEEHPASFTVLPREQLAKLREDLERLTTDIPRPALDFLRGQFFLHHRLYAQAGEQFARLSREFPEQAWPRQAVVDVSAALAVDPAAFLR